MSDQLKELIPKLRFKEFESANGWNLKRLDALCDVLQGYGFPEVLQGKNIGKYPFCKVSDISKAVAENGGLLSEASNYIDEIELKQLRAKLIPKGATVFAKIGEALRLNRRAYVLKECLIDNNVTGLKAIDGKAVDYFVYQLSQLIDLNKHCGGAVPSVNKSTLEEIKVIAPSIEEQQKIADCLSTLDDLITAQNQKVEALKQHKKGLMQQLFPAEGETLPKLRFPEFRNKLGWDEKQLKHACDMQAGKFVQASEIKSSSSDALYPCYGGNGLRGYTKTFTHEGTYSLIGRQGALCGNINLVSGFFHATEHALVTTPKNGVDTNWLFYKLELLNLNQYATGQAQPGLSVENLERVEIKIPRDLEEQQEIAKCLSALDKNINMEISKADLLKRHKKSLMQQLFPMIEYGEE